MHCFCALLWGVCNAALCVAEFVATRICAIHIDFVCLASERLSTTLHIVDCKLVLSLLSCVFVALERLQFVSKGLQEKLVGSFRFVPTQTIHSTSPTSPTIVENCNTKLAIIVVGHQRLGAKQHLFANHLQFTCATPAAH